jgi:hypothetical protein
MTNTLTMEAAAEPTDEAFEAALTRFFEGCQLLYERHMTKLRKGTYAEGRTDLPKTTWRVDRNSPRYIRVVRNGIAHCFVDKLTRDVLKAKDKRPAKGARGNVHDAAHGLQFMGPFGPPEIWKCKKRRAT